MTGLFEEYHNLIVETRLFVQAQLPERSLPEQSRPLPPIKAKQPSLPPPSPKSEIKIPEKAPLIVETPPIKAKNQIVGSFTLEKTTSFAPIDLSSMRTTCYAPFSHLLLATHSDQMPFLRKIADALKQHRFPFELLLLTEKSSYKELLMAKNLKILITEFDPELTRLAALSIDVEHHKFFPFSHEKRILFLHPISSYLSSIERKRHLWNSLKTLLPL